MRHPVRHPVRRPPRLPALLLLALLASGGCAGTRSSYPSVPRAKEEVREYVESGGWERAIERVTTRALDYLRRRAPQVARPAIVLDIDETSLSNWPYSRDLDFAWSRSTWNAWVDRADARAIEPTLELYRWASGNDVGVFFVTGRREPTRAATEANLRAEGFERWERLEMMPAEWGEGSAAFKSARRREIEEAGWTVVLTLGDQPSDLEGGHAERGFLLPNPMYTVD